MSPCPSVHASWQLFPPTTHATPQIQFGPSFLGRPVLQPPVSNPQGSARLHMRVGLRRAWAPRARDGGSCSGRDEQDVHRSRVRRALSPRPGLVSRRALTRRVLKTGSWIRKRSAPLEEARASVLRATACVNKAAHHLDKSSLFCGRREGASGRPNSGFPMTPPSP